MIACQEGHEETIKILIVYRADMEKRCKYNNMSLTALMIASQHGRDIIVQILIDAGAQTFPPPQEGSKDLEELVIIDTEEEQTEQFGWTPLMIACKYGRSEIVRILISHMENNDIISNIEQTDKKGWNSLMFASSNGDLDTVEFLIKEGSDVNKVHEDMWSALMLACEKGNEDVVKLLLMSDGLDTTLTNVDGETAKDIAKMNGFHDIANLL